MKYAIGRLPILDQYNGLHAYHLLARRTSHSPDDATVTSSQLIVDAFLDLGIEKVAGRNTTYINVSEGFLLRPELAALAPDQSVLVVPSSLRPTAEVLDGLQNLKANGFAVALWGYSSTAPAVDLVTEVDAVMIDTRRGSAEELAGELEALQGMRLLRIALLVDTMERRHELDGIGFDCFHGPFLRNPKVISGHRLESSRVAVLDLLSKLSDPSTTVDDIERIITTDPALSLRILRFVNSPLSGLTNEIESIHHAIVLIGRDMIKSWVTLLALSKLDGTIPELLSNMFVRAKFCELYAREGGMAPAEAFFTAGLLSLMDAMMGVSMAEIVETLPLTAELKQGLVTKEGPYGRALEAVELMEDGMSKRFHKEGLVASRHAGIYLDATRWADEAMNLATAVPTA
jgi:EAL and modified HD-GYP domain-containing signal transduction protein